MQSRVNLFCPVKALGERFALAAEPVEHAGFMEAMVERRESDVVVGFDIGRDHGSALSCFLGVL